MGELDGKVALVTGGGSGVGEATVRAFAAAGARVVVAAQHEAHAKVVADSIVAGGGEALAVGFDTSNETQVAEGVQAAVETFGGIDILHNNAAITSVEFMLRDGMIHELDVELWDETMAVNLRGYMLCAKHTLPHMVGNGGGVIVNTASGAGMQAEFVRAAYGTSKAAVIGFTRNVATQYGKQGVRCVAVVPGLVMTPTVVANMPAPMIAMMRRHHLTPELPAAEDIANAVVFLASDRAAFITGIALSVDGGFSIHSPSYADELMFYAAASGSASAAVADTFRAALGARGRELVVDDAALLEGAIAEGAVWHGGSDGATWGREELVKRWSELSAHGEIVIGDVYADDTHVVGLLDITSADGDRTIRQANLFHLDMQGKATAIWSMPTDEAIIEALETGEPVREHPNLARFRAAEEARARNVFDEADLGCIREYLREDVHWRSPWGAGPSSRDEVVQQFGAFKAATGGSMNLALGDVFADDSHALSLVRLTADRPDRPDKHMDVKEANVFHLDDEGRAYEFWGVADDQGALNSFWTD
jgi:NAD(P)-dependent dehydrogenase (short-subunit alcohol dehydrogenase family)